MRLAMRSLFGKYIVLLEIHGAFHSSPSGNGSQMRLQLRRDVCMRQENEDGDGVRDGAHIVCMHCWWQCFLFRRLETSVTRRMWSATRLTRLAVISDSVVMVLDVGDIRALTCAVGETVDPTCCNESLPRIAGHIIECMLNLTVEAPLLNQNQKVVIMLILVFVLVIVVSGGGEGLGE